MGIKKTCNLRVEDIRPISLSFKKNEDELELYKWVLNHSGYSNFIKDILREAKATEEGSDKISKTQSKLKSATNLLDF
jgi:hypothetical protein